jgi:hypothetical protein
MAVPRLDPRLNADRILDYETYRRVRLEFPGRRRKLSGWRQYVPTIRSQYKLSVGAGLAVLVAALGLMAFFSADSARLAYAHQELRASLGALDQSQSEAVGEQVQYEHALYAGDVVSSADVVYPASTKYLVLTNIPQASGKRLVEELYPLSRRIIRLEP